MLRFPSGVEGVVEFGFRGFYTPRVALLLRARMVGSSGTVKASCCEKNGNEIHESLPTKSTYQLQLEAFAKSVRGEKSNALPPEDAVLTARVLDAMYEKAGLALRGTLQTS